MMLFSILFGLLTWVAPDNGVEPGRYFEVQAANGDGVITLLGRYHLSSETCNVAEFYRLNALDSKDALYLGRTYKLPLLIYKYNGRSIRSTIGITDYAQAVRIQKYNELMHRKNMRSTDYRESKILWVPFHELNCHSDSPTKNLVSRKSYHLPILGKAEADVEIKSDALKDQVYYIISGHGGPDPGAVGKRGSHMMCEDEYAYDVALRLFKLLLEQGAKAYLIVEDQNDGIRNGEILPCDQDERCRGAVIPLNQAKRLKQRVNEVNQLYQANKKKGFQNQTAISIHVDSRSKNHRQDVFFCYYPTSKSSKSLAETMQKTFAQKYQRFRAGGHYAGEIDDRDNLYVLRHTTPKAILIELANIQNKADHRRIVQASNRQALANWMLEGLLQAAK
ncbi:MAG: N-acetylmuramoyl-L-alanine amidase [Saprospiraceae bacterium]|nr:N-acetylmuramoyl-L-alanine amidase [Saprospiraceae bacterium]